MKRTNRGRERRRRDWLRNVCALAVVPVAATILSVASEPVAPPQSAAEQKQSQRALAMAAALQQDASQAAAAAAKSSTDLPDREAVAWNLDLLKSGYEELKQIPHYTATFLKQERIAKEMTDPQVIQLKLRHEPFSVYMRWLQGEVGREVLYVDGEYDGDMLVKVGGWKARVVPPLRLAPDCSLAMQQSRYPVTQVGLLALCETLIQDRERDLDEDRNVRCDVVDELVCNERTCYRFELCYDDPSSSEIYRKSVQYIDKEWRIPICVKNFTWPSRQDAIGYEAKDLDDRTLIEFYSYSDVCLDSLLADSDFDSANSEYCFNRSR